MRPSLVAPSAVFFMLVSSNGTYAKDDGTTVIGDTPHITMFGSASTEVRPDLATIRLGVSKTAPTAKAAVDAVAPLARAVVDAAMAVGVKDADITTTSVTLEQTFEDKRDPQGRVISSRPSGYAASDHIEIRTRDMSGVGTLAQTLIDKGSNSLDGVNFEVEHPEPIVDRLSKQAIADGQRHAEMVVAAAGAKLGPVLLIEPRDDVQQVFRFSGGATMGRMPLPIEPGMQKLSSAFKITWAIDHR